MVSSSRAGDLALLGLPSQNRLSSCRGFVESSHSSPMGRRPDNVRRLLAFLGDGAHRVDEEVEFLAALGLGRFDHDRAGSNQRKRHRRRVESVIDDSFRNVAVLDPECVLATVRENDFVEHAAFVRERVHILETVLDVIGIEAFAAL